MGEQEQDQFQSEESQAEEGGEPSVLGTAAKAAAAGAAAGAAVGAAKGMYDSKRSEDGEESEPGASESDAEGGTEQ